MKPFLNGPLVLGTAALLAACSGSSDTTINRLYPDLAVTTLSGVEDTVLFGDVTVLYTTELPFSMVNAGRAALAGDGRRGRPGLVV